MTDQHLSSTARAPVSANNGAGEADDYTFRAPRHSDLVTCPYCGGDSFDRCDWCGDEGTIFADEFFDEE